MARIKASVWRLAELTYAEVADIVANPRRAVALIPVGSTEAHGPHLPLGTDSIIAEGMAAAAAERLAELGLCGVVFPTTHYAVTDWAGSFAGSTSLRDRTATSMFLDTALAADKMGFDRVALVSAHLEPGHIASLRKATEEFIEQTGRPLVFPDKTRRRHAERLGAEFRSGSCHAGRYETSIVLACRPDLVRTAVAQQLPTHIVPLHEHIAAGKQSFADCGMDQAYCGTPREATADEGRGHLAVLGEIIADAVVASFDDTSTTP